MSSKKMNEKIQTLVPTGTRQAAEKLLYERGVSLNDFVRCAIFHLIETGEAPFQMRVLGIRPGRPSVAYGGYREALARGMEAKRLHHAPVGETGHERDAA
ncbi:hypothetical protein [Cupriavidus sp. TMH.W2]|uniref:hypothetical protein n=1 Tax=Cupriavidus sp. TMH.W2 TaxID=3434465 RepID=UPI003D76EA8C